MVQACHASMQLAVPVRNDVLRDRELMIPVCDSCRHSGSSGCQIAIDNLQLVKACHTLTSLAVPLVNEFYCHHELEIQHWSYSFQGHASSCHCVYHNSQLSCLMSLVLLVGDPWYHISGKNSNPGIDFSQTPFFCSLSKPPSAPK